MAIKRSIGSGRSSRKVGLMIELGRSFGRRLIEGIASYAAARSGWEMRVIDGRDFGKGNLDGYDGFIIRVMNEQIAKALKATGKPVVDVYAGLPFGPFASVDCNDSAIGALAADLLISRHFAHFAYCGISSSVACSYNRGEAFASRLAANGFSVDFYKAPDSMIFEFDDVNVIGDKVEAAPDADALREWVAGLEKPCGIFCSHDLRACQLLMACNEAGVKVPDDVAIVGVDDDTMLCNFVSPAITSVDPDAYSIGSAAAEMLDALMDGTEDAHHAKVPPRGVVERGSTETYPLKPSWLAEAVLFIGRNATKGANAADVFDYLKLSHTAVEAKFTEVLHTTVQKEITRIRMGVAARLLRTTSLAAAEIAVRSGYRRPQYFCRVFMKSFGMTPGEYREKYRHDTGVMIDPDNIANGSGAKK